MKASENTNHENSSDVLKLQIAKTMADFLRMSVIDIA